MSSCIHRDANFNNSVFQKDANFSDSTFKKKARFQSVSFQGKTKFSNASFADLVDFFGAEFHKSVIFYKTDFLGVTVFSTTVFHENVLFTYSLIKEVVIFRGTNFLKGLDLSLLVSEGKYTLFDIRLKDFVTVANQENDKEYENYITTNAIITDKNKRETFRALKKQLQNQGNYVDSYKYASLEMITLRKELRRATNGNNITSNRTVDRITLFFNYHSNKFNTDWLRGVLFTIVASFLFFYFSILSTEKYYFGFDNITTAGLYECFTKYFSFLSPAHNIEYLGELTPTWPFYIFDFLGRIFIAYGIYQTVVAFRKFKITG